jgi:transcription factor WhiB
MGRFAWKQGWPYTDRKICSRCSVVKMLSEFGETPSGYLGHNAMCRACNREQWAVSYKPKSKSSKPNTRAIAADKLINAYGKLLFSDEEPACLTVPDKHKDNWFAPHNTWEHLVAKGYCHTCPLFEECLDLTVMVKPSSGVWAGLNAADRRVVGATNKEALRAEFDFQKANGAYMSSYLKTHKSYARWDRTKEDSTEEVDEC